MTGQELLMAGLRGKQTPQMPFAARIDLWYNYNQHHGSLPEKYSGMTMIEIGKRLGIPLQSRLFSVVIEHFEGVEVRTTQHPPYVTTEYITPVGTLKKTLLYAQHEGPWIAYEHEKLFKSPEDYAPLNYLMTHTMPRSNENAYDTARTEVGSDGLVVTGVGLWSPAQRVMREIMGYQTFFYELMDRPARVEELIESVSNLERRKYRLALDSDLEVFNVCANWSDDIHTPIFSRFMAPWFSEITALLHDHGRLAMAHVDGENRRLVPLMRETDIDIWEAWTPAPMTRLSNIQFRSTVHPESVIWGGLPSTLFEPTCSESEFNEYVINNLLGEVGHTGRFIIGMGDNLPFDGIIDRVARVPELVDSFYHNR
jgi:hypothetical protein